MPSVTLRSLSKRLLLFLLLVSAGVAGQENRKKPFNAVEATILEMQRAMATKRVTSRELVQQYLNRIALYDSKLNATIETPRADRKSHEQRKPRS